MSRQHNHCGLTPQERSVMDLFDAGLGSIGIARRLALSRATVSGIIGTYAHDSRKADEKGIASGSAAYLAAIRAAHPERCMAGAA